MNEYAITFRVINHESDECAYLERTVIEARSIAEVIRKFWTDVDVPAAIVNILQIK